MNAHRLHHFRLTTNPDAPELIRVAVTVEGEDTPSALDLTPRQAAQLGIDLINATDTPEP